MNLECLTGERSEGFSLNIIEDYNPSRIETVKEAFLEVKIAFSIRQFSSDHFSLYAAYAIDGLKSPEKCGLEHSMAKINFGDIKELILKYPPQELLDHEATWGLLAHCLNEEITAALTQIHAFFQSLFEKNTPQDLSKECIIQAFRIGLIAANCFSYLDQENQQHIVALREIFSKRTIQFPDRDVNSSFLAFYLRVFLDESLGETTLLPTQIPDADQELAEWEYM